MPKFTKPIGLKFADADFRIVQARALQEGKFLGEWCRDKILEAIRSRATHPGEYAIMAEVNNYRLEGGSFVGLSITNRLSS